MSIFGHVVVYHKLLIDVILLEQDVLLIDYNMSIWGFVSATWRLSARHLALTSIYNMSIVLIDIMLLNFYQQDDIRDCQQDNSWEWGFPSARWYLRISLSKMIVENEDFYQYDDIWEFLSASWRFENFSKYAKRQHHSHYLIGISNMTSISKTSCSISNSNMLLIDQHVFADRRHLFRARCLADRRHVVCCSVLQCVANRDVVLIDYNML